MRGRVVCSFTSNVFPFDQSRHSSIFSEYYSRQVRSKRTLASAGTEASHSCRCTSPLSGGEVCHRFVKLVKMKSYKFDSITIPVAFLTWLDWLNRPILQSKSRIFAPRMAFSLPLTGGRLLFRPIFSFVCFLTLLQSRPTEEVFLTSSDPSHHRHRISIVMMRLMCRLSTCTTRHFWCTSPISGRVADSVATQPRWSSGFLIRIQDKISW